MIIQHYFVTIVECCLVRQFISKCTHLIYGMLESVYKTYYKVNVMIKKGMGMMQPIILPLSRCIIFMMADGWFHSQHHLVDLSQMTEVHPHVSKGLFTEFTAKRPTWAYLRVMELHMGAQAARVRIGFATYWTDVRPTVGVTVHVILEVVLELETAAAGGTTVEWTAAYEHSGMGSSS